MSKINILPESVSNLIAAGEVVERPASAVKELVQNSIDAGATLIRIEIRNDGRKLISVTDNGSGMDQEDALLCLQPHGTSKIDEAGDIDAITTLGFRGEALPSIAAVSRLRIRTKTADSLEGFETKSVVCVNAIPACLKTLHIANLPHMASRLCAKSIIPNSSGYAWTSTGTLTSLSATSAPFSSPKLGRQRTIP